MNSSPPAPPDPGGAVKDHDYVAVARTAYQEYVDEPTAAYQKYVARPAAAERESDAAAGWSPAV